MSDNRSIKYIENSFLSSILSNEEITDISYNGKSLFYQHNFEGRRKIDFEPDEEEMRSFVRQIANLSSKQFSYSNPTLDVSFGKYRFTAIHHSIGKVKNKDVISFSLRIASDELKIKKDDDKFFPKCVGELIDIIIDSNLSIVIGGITGSGKTEFQKYLITRMREYTRVIAIDTVLELDSIDYPNDIDLNIWKADEKNEEMKPASLVRTALRCNPDWLILAEARGKEMIDILNSAMTGHPIITTLHAFNINSVPKRMARMVLDNNLKMNIKGVLEDIYMHFPFYFYLKKEMMPSGEIKRYLDSIMFISEKGKQYIIYQKHDDTYEFNPLPDEAIKLLKRAAKSQYFEQMLKKGEIGNEETNTL